jgi:hypothetical protein
MPWINTRKTPYGFEYSIGTIPVARAKWVKTHEGAWKVHVSTLAPSDFEYTEGQFDVATMPLNEVTAYLHKRLENPMPTPVID